MSHVRAYCCNACGNLKHDDEIVGIIAVEDLFEKTRNYPTVHTEAAIRKCIIHYCTTCYNEKVINKITVDKGRDKELYKIMHDDLHLLLRRQCVLTPKFKPI